MNRYAASVALLWNTAMRARPTPQEAGTGSSTCEGRALPRYGVLRAICRYGARDPKNVGPSR